MRLTPGQVRDVVGVPVETFRHWRTTLTGLGGKSGHSPCFTIGDAVGFAVVRQLVESMGVRVSMIADAGEPLFDVCNITPWHVLETSYLLVDIAGNSVERVTSLPADIGVESLVVINLRTIMEGLRAHLMPSAPDHQGRLPFLPLDLAQRRTA